MKVFAAIALILLPGSLLAAVPDDLTWSGWESFAGCTESSEFVPSDDAELTFAFCEKWRPDFSARGFRCCPAPARGPRRVRRRSICPKTRAKASFCDERTPEQIEYEERAAEGQLGDILALLAVEAGRHSRQAFCSINNGFLAWGRPLVATAENRIQVRTPARCAHYGTDPMVGMLEWVGRQVEQQYAGDERYDRMKLLVGDISAPRGGCLLGRGGRVGHASHTSGQDVDIGFLTPIAGRASPEHFHRDFDVKANWFLVKQIFENPFACVKVVFLDRRLIRKLGKAMGPDPEWPRLSRFLRHVRGHGNHFHVRVGEGPGIPGCAPDAHPELEPEEELPTDAEAGPDLEASQLGQPIDESGEASSTDEAPNE